MTFEEFQAQKQAASTPSGLSFEQWKASKAQKEPGIASKVLNTAGDIGMGALQGAADIGSTIMQPIDYLRDNTGQMNIDRRAGVKAGLDSLGADRESLAFKGGDIGLNVASWVLPGMAATKTAQAGSLLSKAGSFLGGEAPLKTSVSMASGLAAGDAAKTSLKDNTDMSSNQKLAAEVAANIGGSLGASGVIGIAKMAGRTVPRLASAITGDVEGLAGRLINRSAGDEAAYVQSILESGKVPTIAQPISGYAPRSSEISGNAGISGLVRHAENDIMNSSQLAGRNFQNAKTIKDFLQRKTAGTQQERDIYEAAIRADAAANSQGFKARNAPVDLKSVEDSLRAAIKANEGNPSITRGLNKVLNDMPKSKTTKTELPWVNEETGRSGINVVENTTPIGFKDAYNYKQYIDEMLRGNAFDDPVKRSIQQSGIALGNTKKALSNALTAVEPEFAPFLQRQAEGISRLERRNLADELIQKMSKNTSIVSNVNGNQETLNALTAPQLSALLKNKKVTSKLSDAQIEAFSRAQQHAELASRASAGMSRGSNTAQNLKTNELVMDDIIRGLTGDKANGGMLSGALRALGKSAGSVPLLRNLSPISSRQAEISAIMAKAELDPKYMAELMRKYQTLDAPIDPSVRGALGAALRSSLSQNAQ